MRPIIEASLQNEYKLLIGRLLRSLKKNGKSAEDNFWDTFHYRFNEKNYHATLRGTFIGSIRDIHIVEVTNTIYFVADITSKVSNLYYDFWSTDSTTKSIEDSVIDYIKYYGRTSTFYYSIDKQIKNDMVNDGLSKINLNNDDDIRNSAIYKTLLNHANEVSDVNISFVMKSEVCKRIKERDNVIPIMWINIKEGVLDYPSSYLRSSNLMSNTCRSKSDLTYLKSDNNHSDKVTEQAIKYTSYRRWLDVKMDKVSDEITHII